MATALTTDRTVRDTVVGVFHSHAEARRAVADLKKAGFTDEQIGVASRDREGTFAEQNEETMAEEGAVAGA
ncbi:general stress protein, partial [Alienimonas sp. DA493]|uniref:general stress protein n=1 Tax=Alienimonas sp. DA493 TaxID=3373605 RepID=UPI00375481A6